MRETPKADEIEVTPEMIEAGERVLADSACWASDGLSTLTTTENILRAALTAAGFAVRIGGR